MDSKTKTILFILLGLGIIITTIYWWDVSLNIPTALVLGLPVFVTVIIIILIADAMRLRTEHFIFNEGHYSIRPADLKDLPWQESTNDAVNRNPFSETLKVCLLGGIQAWELYLRGAKEHPVLIFPAIYLMEVGHNFVCLAHLDKTPFHRLPLYVQDYLIALNSTGGLLETKGRMNFETTPFYYGNTSRIDGSLTPMNAAKERTLKLQNEENTFYEQRQNRFISSAKKDQDFSKKDVIYATPLKQKNGDQEEES
jgi:hypothetical protein